MKYMKKGKWKMLQHSKLSPSASHRWGNCPASIQASEGIETTTSAAAEEGTAAHEMAEKVLKDETLGEVASNGVAFTGEMREAVDVYVDYINEGRAAKGVECSVENKLSLSDFDVDMPVMTSDCILYRDSHKHLVVVDYKHGKGIVVEVKDNSQLMTYGYAAARRYHNRGVDKVTLVIVQPRAPHPDGPIRSVTMSMADLEAWAKTLKIAADRTREESPARVAGDWCRWCPAAPFCEELMHKAQAAAQNDFADVEDLDLIHLSKALIEVPILKEWIKAVEERAFHEARHGRTPPGYKLVQKKAQRKWKNEADAKKALRRANLKVADIEAKSLKSPPQIEKLTGKKKFADFVSLVVSKSSGLTLVSAADKRPAQKVGAVADFS
ncbi:MAG: DUF2800 domain-containing protein [Chloroflexi bacterium]|nr:DUF2800 domain-containing protein [Chloroflexota bacterium]